VVDSLRPLNLVTVVRLSGHVTADALRAALDATQARHPLLRCRIGQVGQQEKFEFDTAPPVPFETAPRTGREQWLTVVQAELHRPVDVATGPLLRCHYLGDSAGGDIILTWHHAIVDARSAAALIHELVARCAGVAVVPGDDTAGEGRFPARSLYPDPFRGVRLARAVAAYLGRQVADELAFRRQARNQRRPPVAPDGQSGILSMSLPAPLTSALVRASRHEGVTLNALLAAGLMVAVQRRVYHTERGLLRHITFADLRPRLRREVPDGVLGCMMTMLRFTLTVDQQRGIWPLARDIQQATNQAVRSGDRYVTELLSPLAMKMVVGQQTDRLSATALSYAGPLALPVRCGPLEVLGVHAFTTALPLGPEFSAFARLFRGQIWCDVQYLDSDMDAAGARRVADEFRSILEEAT
jgi:hypothetical protein